MLKLFGVQGIDLMTKLRKSLVIFHNILKINKNLRNNLYTVYS